MKTNFRFSIEATISTGAAAAAVYYNEIDHVTSAMFTFGAVAWGFCAIRALIQPDPDD